MSSPAVDQALSALRGVLLPRVGRRATQVILQNMVRLVESPGSTEAMVLGAIAQAKEAFARRPPEGSPLDLPRTIAQVEVAPRKLSHLSWRLDRGAPLLGLEDVEAQAIGTHADALLPAFGPEDAEHCASLALANILGFGRQLILGECWNRNDPTPRLLLAEEAAPYLSQENSAPVALWRDRGVILAVGDRLPQSLAERWAPFAFVYRGRDGTLLELHQVADLKRFFALWAPPITAATLGGILWAALLPFPLRSTVALTDRGLVDRWVSEESRLEDERLAGRAASALLGLPSPTPLQALECLELHIEPAGATVVYRPGELTVR
jgi:hypothetical protein